MLLIKFYSHFASEKFYSMQKKAVCSGEIVELHASFDLKPVPTLLSFCNCNVLNIVY